MKYVFFEENTISNYQKIWLSKNYINYIDKLAVELYILLCDQSYNKNFLYDVTTIYQRLNISSPQLSEYFEQLDNVELLKIYKDEKNYVINVLQVKVNTQYYDNIFVQEKSPYKYDHMTKVQFKKEKNIFAYENIKFLLGNLNIKLTNEEIKKINDFNKIYKFNSLKLVKLIKRTYNTSSLSLDFDKLLYLSKSNTKSKIIIDPGILEFINIQTKGLYANKDLDAFLKLIQKYTQLQKYQLKAIITYSYKTQSNIYFNFIDKLAITLIKKNTSNYEESLKLLNEKVTTNNNFQKTISKKVKNIDLVSLKRENVTTEKITIKDLLGK